ncbi:MAG: hypothetical protein ACKVTZ_10975 [Bacteroidia bacterium]
MATNITNTRELVLIFLQTSKSRSVQQLGFERNSALQAKFQELFAEDDSVASVIEKLQSANKGIQLISAENTDLQKIGAGSHLLFGHDSEEGITVQIIEPPKTRQDKVKISLSIGFSTVVNFTDLFQLSTVLKPLLPANMAAKIPDNLAMPYLMTFKDVWEMEPSETYRDNPNNVVCFFVPFIGFLPNVLVPPITPIPSCGTIYKMPNANSPSCFVLISPLNVIGTIQAFSPAAIPGLLDTRQTSIAKGTTKYKYSPSQTTFVPINNAVAARLNPVAFAFPATPIPPANFNPTFFMGNTGSTNTLFSQLLHWFKALRNWNNGTELMGVMIGDIRTGTTIGLPITQTPFQVPLWGVNANAAILPRTAGTPPLGYQNPPQTASQAVIFSPPAASWSVSNGLTTTNITHISPEAFIVNDASTPANPNFASFLDINTQNHLSNNMSFAAQNITGVAPTSQIFGLIKTNFNNRNNNVNNTFVSAILDAAGNVIQQGEDSFLPAPLCPQGISILVQRDTNSKAIFSFYQNPPVQNGNFTFLFHATEDDISDCMAARDLGDTNWIGQIMPAVFDRNRMPK